MSKEKYQTTKKQSPTQTARALPPTGGAGSGAFPTQTARALPPTGGAGSGAFPTQTARALPPTGGAGSGALISALMRFEGLRLEAYRDTGGVLTIGYGHTKGVQEGDKISEYWARELLKEDVEKVTHQVLKLGVCHTQGQLDALVSFTFNLGINRLRSSTLLKVIRNGGSAHQTQKEFKRWVYCNGKRMRGLEIRREWEAERWEEVPAPHSAPEGATIPN